MAIIVYPGTFDPLTNGHIDLIHRATRLFDTVIVAVAAGHHKKTLFSLDERINFAQDVFKGISKVKVTPLTGLLVDFVKAERADAILRGLRTAADFEYEFQLAGMNRSLAPECETIFMTPSKETLFISSTLIREIIALKGNVSAFVPPVVMERLKHVA